jgi:hypothetical protein
MTKTACINRHKLGRANPPREAYISCRSCNVGRAHARGEPTPRLQEVLSMAEAVSEAKEWPPRMCKRGKHLFKPKTATARACEDLGCKRRVAAEASAVSPARVLELAGFKVSVLGNTPNGELLQVSR